MLPPTPLCSKTPVRLKEIGRGTVNALSCMDEKALRNVEKIREEGFANEMACAGQNVGLVSTEILHHHPSAFAPLIAVGQHREKTPSLHPASDLE